MFRLIFPMYIPGKYQKTSSFWMFSGFVEKEHWSETSYRCFKTMFAHNTIRGRYECNANRQIHIQNNDIKSIHLFEMCSRLTKKSREQPHVTILSCLYCYL